MDIGVFRGLITAALMVLFVGLVGWAWSRKRKPDFEEAANLPLGDDHRPPREKEEQAQ